MSYKITQYTKSRAKEIGAIVKPSKNPKKKIDVFDKDGNFLTAVGAVGYKDYPTYMKEKGKEYADERRRLFKIRHQKNRTKEGSDAWFADQLLW
jgi:hypothetical protein